MSNSPCRGLKAWKRLEGKEIFHNGPQGGSATCTAAGGEMGRGATDMIGDKYGAPEGVGELYINVIPNMDQITSTERACTWLLH